MHSLRLAQRTVLVWLPITSLVPARGDLVAHPPASPFRRWLDRGTLELYLILRMSASLGFAN
jgi:hypothetical protein